MIEFMQNVSSYPITWGYRIKPIYRILSNEVYLNDFFEKGNLFISCFNNFKNYKDEMQGDSSEGDALVGGFTEKGDGNFIVYEGGVNAFILCATNNLTEDVIKDFNGVGAIKINNPALFAIEIARKLPFVLTGVEGDCIYDDSKAHILKEEKNKIFQNINFKNPAEIQHKILQITTGIEIFTKYKKYEHQQEHRLVWFSERAVESGIVINCPEAVEHCEKILF
ncbi:hypothetical protein EG349_17000 [Chryseobacterium shandongense]|uniref:Uncharacterized protein n=1 Tax=Chryseobacterium shandongense TaxID=1493872 RepID=A0AAD0YGI4_9FLAO|nr:MULTISPECIES: hypothetical protein [Chryseobacterium]AZA88347.1 hypothetical protein EG349_17000 [Chryseobacterium shandongense]